jgi:hypothetical protein
MYYMVINILGMVSLSFESNLVSQVTYLFPSSSYSIMETSISWSFSIIQ